VKSRNWDDDEVPDLLRDPFAFLANRDDLSAAGSGLHTVAIAIKHGGALDPEPFIVVGLVAGIRRVLILTAEAEQAFHWNPQGIELLILMALILAMAIATLVWRYAIRPRKRVP
jgi:phosphate-starvation-inducible protein E